MTDTLEWTGRVGDAWAAEWRRTDGSFAALSEVLDAEILAAAPVGAFRALDVGCGAGGTSLALAGARYDAAITGIDLSAELIAVAQQRVPDVVFDVGDVAALAQRNGPFDLIYSRHGVMFFPDPMAGFAALRRAAAPGARLVFSCFRARAENGWMRAIDAALGIAPPGEPSYTPGPFGLADARFTGEVLRQAGWADAQPRAVDYVYVAGAGDDPVADATGFLSRIGPAARMIAALEESERRAMLAKLQGALAEHLVDGRVTFPAAAWIWTATAGEPA